MLLKHYLPAFESKGVGVEGGGGGRWWPPLRIAVGVIATFWFIVYNNNGEDHDKLS